MDVKDINNFYWKSDLGKKVVDAAADKVALF
jgi:hypothetical protein